MHTSGTTCISRHFLRLTITENKLLRKYLFINLLNFHKTFLAHTVHLENENSCLLLPFMHHFIVFKQKITFETSFHSLETNFSQSKTDKPSEAREPSSEEFLLTDTVLVLTAVITRRSLADDDTEVPL